YVARHYGQPQRLVFAPLHGRVVERLDRLDDRQRFGRVAALLGQLGGRQTQVGFGAGCLDGLFKLRDRGILVVVPPEQVAQRQARVEAVGGRCGGLGLLAKVGRQVTGKVVAPVELEGVAQQDNRAVVVVIIRQWERNAYVLGLGADPNRVVRR